MVWIKLHARLDKEIEPGSSPTQLDFPLCKRLLILWATSLHTPNRKLCEFDFNKPYDVAVSFIFLLYIRPLKNPCSPAGFLFMKKADYKGLAKAGLGEKSRGCLATFKYGCGRKARATTAFTENYWFAFGLLNQAARTTPERTNAPPAREIGAGNSPSQAQAINTAKGGTR